MWFFACMCACVCMVLILWVFLCVIVCIVVFYVRYFSGLCFRVNECECVVCACFCVCVFVIACVCGYLIFCLCVVCSCSFACLGTAAARRLVRHLPLLACQSSPQSSNSTGKASIFHQFVQDQVRCLAVSILHATISRWCNSAPYGGAVRNPSFSKTSIPTRWRTVYPRCSVQSAMERPGQGA